MRELLAALAARGAAGAMVRPAPGLASSNPNIARRPAGSIERAGAASSVTLAAGPRGASSSSM
ncbi:MAG: hypothetical protein ACTHU0_04485 [Kofleriaceae bacterium]